jgi:hypothetical protein
MGLMVVDDVTVEGDGDFFEHFSKVLTKGWGEKQQIKL